MQTSMKKEAEQLEEKVKNVQTELKKEDQDALLSRIYEELEEEGERVKKKKRRHITWKGLATVVAAACICVVVFSHQSEARHLYFMQSIKQFFGNSVSENGDNDEDRKKTDVDIYQVSAEIQEKLDIPVPEFFYLPDGFKLSEYYINKESEIAEIKFQHKKDKFWFHLENSEADASASVSQNDKAELKKEVALNDTKERIFIYQIEQEQEYHRAQWKYKNHSYELFGTLSLEEMEKILKNMWF